MQVNKCNSNVNFKARLIKLPDNAGYIWPRQVVNIKPAKEEDLLGTMISFVRKENVSKSSTDGSDHNLGSSCVWEEAVEQIKQVFVRGKKAEDIAELVSKAENESGNVIILG